MQTVTRKIGQNRGKRRLWLEGKILLENGFIHKAEYTVTKDCFDGSILIQLITSTAPKGIRKVAGTVDRPIIDIMNQDYLAQIGDTVIITVPYSGALRIRSGA